MVRYNCHVHIFTSNYTPLDVVRFGNSPFIKKSFSGDGESMNPPKSFSKKRIFRLHNIVQRFLSHSMKEHLINLINLYNSADASSDWKFCIMTQNFDYASRMRHQSFDDQYQAVKALKINPDFKDKIFLFYGLDPRTPLLLRLIDMEWIKYNQIDGFKIYPPFGFYPNDLGNDFFELVSTLEIPLVVHCSKPNSVFYHGRKPLLGRTTKPEIKKLATEMTSPESWEQVLINYPNLKINFAHFGAQEIEENEWTNRIVELLCNPRYPNLYADISFCYKGLTKVKELVENNPSLSNKLLYGSDYFLQTLEIGERTFLKESINVLGNELFDKLTNSNPRKFLSHRALV